MTKKYVEGMWTLFIDLDGVTFYQRKGDTWPFVRDPIPGSVDKIRDWGCRGYYIVFTTARPEIMRDIVEEMLKKAGLPYHQLIMGLPAKGGRVLINDLGGSHLVKGTSAIAFEVPRNEGLGDVELP